MYSTEGVLGKGQFSVVYKGRDPTGSQVAVKKIHIPNLSDPKAFSDCLKEIKLLQQLDHPNVIKYLSSYVEGNELNIVLELADGGDLQRIVERFTEQLLLIPEQIIWNYVVQIASALEHMHSRRVMHRDIKPANVFLTRDGLVKLGDLGLSRFFSKATLESKTLVGTPYYMSPERLQEQPYTYSSDIWSLGCLIYECHIESQPREELAVGSLYYRILHSLTLAVPVHWLQGTVLQLFDQMAGCTDEVLLFFANDY